MLSFNSAIYRGAVEHCRFAPIEHRFRFNLFYIYADLDELPAIGALTPWWSISRPAPARFRRADFLDPQVPSLKAAVWARVREALGPVPEGPVRLLANWRYFGYVTNPIATYYCFDPDERLVAVLCEVTNTPWGERVQYVLPASAQSSGARTECAKRLRVSPFSDNRQIYRIGCNVPGERLRLTVQCRVAGNIQLAARLRLRREPLTASALNCALWAYPFQTASIILSTYWQAAGLWRKGAPLVGLDNSSNSWDRDSIKEKHL